jgi:hypothetical protein
VLLLLRPLARIAHYHLALGVGQLHLVRQRSNGMVGGRSRSKAHEAAALVGARVPVLQYDHVRELAEGGEGGAQGLLAGERGDLPNEQLVDAGVTIGTSCTNTRQQYTAVDEDGCCWLKGGVGLW